MIAALLLSNPFLNLIILRCFSSLHWLPVALQKTVVFWHYAISLFSFSQYHSSFYPSFKQSFILHSYYYSVYYHNSLSPINYHLIYAFFFHSMDSEFSVSESFHLRFHLYWVGGGLPTYYTTNPSLISISLLVVEPTYHGRFTKLAVHIHASANRFFVYVTLNILDHNSEYTHQRQKTFCFESAVATSIDRLTINFREKLRKRPKSVNKVAIASWSSYCKNR